MTTLTPQQALFCKLYTKRGDTFGNATLSYAIAYDYELPKDDNGKNIITSSEYLTCSANGSRLLTNDNVEKAIQQGMLELLNDNAVDARLSEILYKGQETNSIQAIKIHNELKQRITKKLDITSGGRPLGNLSDEELQRMAGE